MTATILLALLAAFLALVAWNYRCDFRTTTEAYNTVLSHNQELTRQSQTAWDACGRSYRLAKQAEEARIAAEEHANQLRSQIEELKAWCEAQKRGEEDTEIYGEEADRAAEEGGAVQAEGGHGSAQTTSNSNLSGRGDTGVMLGWPK